LFLFNINNKNKKKLKKTELGEETPCFITMKIDLKKRQFWAKKTEAVVVRFIHNYN